MTDTLKEIYAGNVTIADVATTGSATLVTTDANTQYVIKDVNIGSTSLPAVTAPILMINLTPVATVTKSVTGSEIVDISSTVKYKAFTAAPSLVQTNLKLVDTITQNYITSTVNTVNGVAAANSTTTASVPVLLTNAISDGQIANIAFAVNGDFFYTSLDGNSNSILYKRSGSLNGIETTIFSSSYTWIAFNGTDTYYYPGSSGSSILSKYNINTGVTTTIASSPTTILTTPSYPSAFYLNNGMILLCPTGNSSTTVNYIINPVTGAVSTLNYGTAVSMTGVTYRLSGYFNSTTGFYTTYRRAAGGLYKTTFNSTFTVGVTNPAAGIETQYVIANVTCINGYHRCTDTIYSWGNHGVNGSTTLSSLDTATSITTTSDIGINYRTNSASFILAISAATPSTFTDTVAIRITGVKSTI